MSLHRYAAKRDKAEPEVIATFEALHYSVQQVSATGFPDLVVGGWFPCTCPLCGGTFDQQRNELVEVKTGKGKLTVDQVALHGEWQGTIQIARNMHEALRIAGRE